MAGVNPIVDPPGELQMFYRHQQLKDSVLRDCKMLLSYAAEVSAPLFSDRSAECLSALMARSLPRDTLLRFLDPKMLEFMRSRAPSLVESDLTQVLMRKSATSLAELDIPASRDLWRVLLHELNEIKIAFEARDVNKPTNLGDYFYRELQQALVRVLSAWKGSVVLVQFVNKNNLLVDPFDPKPPVVTREEATWTAAAALPVSPAVSASPALSSMSPAPSGTTLQASRTASGPLSVIVEMPGFPAVSATSTPPPPLILDSGGVDDEDEEEVSSTRATPGSTPGSMK